MKTSKKNQPLTKPLYPLESLDRLNYLVKGESTDKLISLVSKSVVQCGIRVYRIMKNIEKEIHPIAQKSLEKAAKPLKFRMDDLIQLISADPKIARRIMYGDLIKSPRNRPPDYALTILVIYLREHLKKITARPKNTLISDFLVEQEIHDNLGPRRISKLARKDLTVVKDIYIFFREIYLAPGSGGRIDSFDPILAFVRKTRRIVVDNPSSERDTEDFPPWDIFMPQ